MRLVNPCQGALILRCGPTGRPGCHLSLIAHPHPARPLSAPLDDPQHLPLCGCVGQERDAGCAAPHRDHQHRQEHQDPLPHGARLWGARPLALDARGRHSAELLAQVGFSAPCPVLCQFSKMCMLNRHPHLPPPPPPPPCIQVYLVGEAVRDKEAAKAVQCSLEYTTLRRVTQVGRGAGRGAGCICVGGWVGVWGVGGSGRAACKLQAYARRLRPRIPARPWIPANVRSGRSSIRPPPAPPAGHRDLLRPRPQDHHHRGGPGVGGGLLRPE